MVELMMDAFQVLAELKRCLRNLASTAEQQLTYLGSLGAISVDELALELDEALDMLWIPTRHGLISEEKVESVERVRSALRDLARPDHASLWSEQGLIVAREWEHIRELASNALECLDK